MGAADGTAAVGGSAFVPMTDPLVQQKALVTGATSGVPLDSP